MLTAKHSMKTNVWNFKGLGKFRTSNNGSRITVIEEKFKGLGKMEEIYLSYLHKLCSENFKTRYRNISRVAILIMLRDVWNCYHYCQGYTAQFRLISKYNSQSYYINVYFKFNKTLTLGDLYDVRVHVEKSHPLKDKIGEQINKRLECADFVKDIKSKPDIDWESLICTEYSYDKLLNWSGEIKAMIEKL